MGSGDSSVVRAPDSWLKGHRFESLQERWENFLLQGQLSVLLFWYPFHPCVTAVARKRSRSFCQKCRWQVTAKHAYNTLHMWLCMKWHGAWLHGVHRTCCLSSSFMWHQPCQRSTYTTSVDNQKRAIKSYSLMQHHMQVQVRLLERGEQRNHLHHICHVTKRKFHDFVNYFPPPPPPPPLVLANDYVRLWKTQFLSNKTGYIFNAPWFMSWVKIHPCFQRILQTVHSGWIFTHTSGSWSWEPTCWEMAARAVNNSEKLDPLKTTEFGPEPRAANDSSWQLITHRHTKHYLCLSQVSVWVGVSLSPTLWTIHDDLYTVRHCWHWNSFTRCSLSFTKWEEHSRLALSLSGVITVILANLELMCCMQTQ